MEKEVSIHETASDQSAHEVLDNDAELAELILKARLETERKAERLNIEHFPTCNFD